MAIRDFHLLKEAPLAFIRDAVAAASHLRIASYAVDPEGLREILSIAPGKARVDVVIGLAENAPPLSFAEWQAIKNRHPNVCLWSYKGNARLHAKMIQQVPLGGNLFARVGGCDNSGDGVIPPRAGT
jgi:hypothetical protein